MKYLMVYCLVELAGILTYLYGYFPVKRPVAGTATFEAERYSMQEYLDESGLGGSCSNSTLLQGSLRIDGRFQRLIFVLIDAMRADFLLLPAGSHMTFTRSLIGQGLAYGFRARAQPPTVTMPRIKALTAGSIPAFIDFVLNIASSEMAEDNWLGQFVHQHRSVIFYGDDTWLKLFPPDRHFVRYEGVTSYFVADYTEIDFNVSRHLDAELTRQDWSAMVLHYLGVDHIGHLDGASSKLLPPKLREMDAVVRKLFEASKVEDLLVVVGDHGMSPTGSHGGASAPEIMVPLVLASKGFQKGGIVKEEVEQVDVVPTLASLMGLPIPQNSMGVLLDGPLVDRQPGTWVKELMRNAVQLRLIAKANGRFDARDEISLSKAIESLCLIEGSRDGLEKKLQMLRSFLITKRNDLVSSFVDYNTGWMVAGLVLAGLAGFCLLRDVYGTVVADETALGSQELVVAWCVSLLFVLHSASLASSSLVEEEHHFWYFVLPGAVLVAVWLHKDLRVSSSRPRLLAKCLVFLALNRACSTWNANGVKWVHEGGNSELIDRPAVKAACLLACYTYLTTTVSKLNHHQRQPWRNRASLAILALTFLSRLSSVGFWTLGQLVGSSRSSAMTSKLWIVYLFILALLAAPCCSCQPISNRLLTSLLLICSYNVRLTNLPVLVCAHWLAANLHKLVVPDLCELTNASSGCKRWFSTSCLYFMLAITSYFYMGNSNNFAAIDLSPGYVGMNEYYPAVAGCLILISTYSGPLIVILTYFEEFKGLTVDEGHVMLGLILGLKLLSTIFYLIVCYVERYHLFVWSVFAPKLLIESCHCCFILCCTILFILFTSLLKI